MSGLAIALLIVLIIIIILFLGPILLIGGLFSGITRVAGKARRENIVTRPRLNADSETPRPSGTS